MHKYFLSLACFMIISCNVGPDYNRPDLFTDEQIKNSLNLTDENSLSVTKDWYTQFNDETLNQLISQALDNNPSVSQGIAKLQQARTIAGINRVQYLPMLNAQGGYDYSKASKNIGLAADSNFFQLGFDASWELDIWGAGRRLTEQSVAQMQQALYELQNIKIVIAAETANTYFLLKTTLEQLQIAKNNLKLQQEIYQTVAEKYASGLADETALNQAKYIIENTKASIPAMEYQLEAYKNALAVLTGSLPDMLPNNVCSTSKNPIKTAYKYDVKSLYNLPISIIRNRPDVKASERALASQNAAIGQAVAELYPNISLSAMFDVQSTAGSKLFNSTSKAYSYAPSLALPLFNWGKLQNNIKLQEYIKDEMLANYRQTLLSAVEDLNNAIIATQKEYQKNAYLRNATYNMQQALTNMRKKYDNGLIDFSQLLQAEQNLLSAENSLAVSNGTLYQNIIAFYKASGGGYAK